MAIQLRRGAYENYDASKLKPAEVGVVQSGDPNTTDGKAVYIAINTNDVKRIPTADEMVDHNAEAEGIYENIVAQNRTASQLYQNTSIKASEAEQSASSASSASASANSSMQRAETAANLLTNVTATAQTLETGQQATASYNNGVFSFGLPKGSTGNTGAKGDKGDTGATPNLSIGTVTTLEPGSDATVEITGTAEAPVLNMGIPRGNTGEVSAEQFYKAFVTDTATGAIASFSDGADNIPMKDVLVHIEPVQDLHGYDSPWPAGGGENVLPPLTSETKNGVTITVSDDGTVTINGTATEDTYFDRDFSASWTIGTPIHIMAFNPVASSSNRLSLFIVTDTGNPQINLNTANAVLSSTASTDAIVTRYRLRAPSGVTYTNFIVRPMLKIGGTVPTAYSPYSNICPITGWTAAKVTRCGKNLADFVNGYGVNTEGRVTPIVNRTSTIMPIRIKSGYRYRFSSNPTVTCIYAVWKGDELVRRIAGTPSGSILNVDGGDTLYVTAYAGSDTNATKDTHHPMITLEDDNYADYEPYSEQTYDIEFPTEAGTVYGGTLDVTTGELVVDRAMVTLDGSESWGWSSNNNLVTTRIQNGIITDGITQYNSYTLNSTFVDVPWTRKSSKDGTLGMFYGDSMLFVKFSEITSADVAKAFFADNPTTVVYELATSITYQLTPQEITSLLGENNVWADTGDSEVEYRANVKMYIDKKITEAVSALS